VWRSWRNLNSSGDSSRPYDGARYGSEGVVKLNKSKVESISWLTARDMEVADFFVQAEPGINCESGFVRFKPDGNPELVPRMTPAIGADTFLPGHWNPGETSELPKDSLLSRFLKGLFRDDDDAAEKQGLLQEVAGAVVAGLGTRLPPAEGHRPLWPQCQQRQSTVLDLLEGLARCCGLFPRQPTPLRSAEHGRSS